MADNSAVIRLIKLRRIELDAKKGSQRSNETKKNAYINDYIEAFRPELH